jgi:Cft2 family RNA processing exonuclease
MFSFDRNIRLDGCELWLDARSAKPYGFVSHAHSDHIAPHRRILATPETLRLCQHRLGKRKGDALPFHDPLQIGACRLTTYAAGHILGSAMLLVESEVGSLLYTGDFRLRPARTCPPAEVPHAEVLIMDSTFGHPRYRFPARKDVEEEFLTVTRTALRQGITPIVFVYSLGKAQEVTHLLYEAGLPVMVHNTIHQVNRLYEELGVALGPYKAWQPAEREGQVCLLPPQARHGRRMLERLKPFMTMQLSGWAMDYNASSRLGVDRCFPYSDHADFDELLELLARVAPRHVYCTHGPEDFVKRLQRSGWDARLLDSKCHQLTLF